MRTEGAEAPVAGCELCRGIGAVSFDRAAAAHPSPFCPRCGREPPVVLVDAPLRPHVGKPRPQEG